MHGNTSKFVAEGQSFDS